MPTRLPYGLKDNQLVSIHDVQKGLDCECVCPACKTRLLAKKGDKNIHHFAHYRGQDCPNGLETTLHLKAKEIISKASYFNLPPVKLLQFGDPLFSTKRLYFQKVDIEKSVRNVIPDALLYVKGRRQPIALEFTVTNSPDKFKIRRLYELQLPSIEIDLKKIYNEQIKKEKKWNETQFIWSIIEDIVHKSWIFNPRVYRLENQVKEEAKIKKVRSYENQYGNQYYYVNDCPQIKRTWKYALTSNKSYANIFQDCLHCKYCFSIKYLKELRGNQMVETFPKEVNCFGHLCQDKRLPRW